MKDEDAMNGTDERGPWHLTLDHVEKTARAVHCGHCSKHRVRSSRTVRPNSATALCLGFGAEGLSGSRAYSECDGEAVQRALRPTA